MTTLPVPEDRGQLFVRRIPEGASQHETAHALLQEGLRRYARQEGFLLPDAPVTVAYARSGKPYLPQLPDVQCSLSHCKGLAAVLLSRFVCGVDAEGERPLRAGVVRRAFAPEEARALACAPDPDALFVRLWTLKEAYTKATGTGIACDMKALCFSLDGDTVQSAPPGADFVLHRYGTFTVSTCLLHASPLS
ncbi:MAG: 4'-phosphopantetheinyl transferase superfamily protein [Oscillospiraceae bacterium]|nr:4'-phosphopantetheinyl transferase superfamily protein [Oscillospiraceae bacterium]